MHREELDCVFAKGATWVTEQGFGESANAEFAEERGCLTEADPAHISEGARNRGRLQLGIIGSGNHFLEIQYVERIHDPQAAAAMQSEPNQVVVLVHCGSRGLGHQVCTDYLAQMGDTMTKYGIALPDRQLGCVPIQSLEGQAYGDDEGRGQFRLGEPPNNSSFLRGSFQRIFGRDARLDLVYDNCHNIAKRERHRVNGDLKDVVVHRKGATRAFPAGRRKLPEAYCAVGQPALVPGAWAR